MIDSAFVDRADIKEYVGYPPPQAVYWILTTCLKELMGKGLVRQCETLEWRSFGAASGEDRVWRVSKRIRTLADKCYVSEGFPSICSVPAHPRLQTYDLAGRFLRRIPILAHARYIATASGSSDDSARPRSIERWVGAMERIVDDERISRGRVNEAEGHRGGTSANGKVGEE